MDIVRLEKYPQFVPTVAEWLYKEWGHEIPGVSVAKIEARLQMFPDAQGVPTAFIALWEGVPVGVARLVAHDMDVRPMLSPWLASVFVLPQFRKRGIGRTLCARVSAEAQQFGFSYIYLFTPDRERFYAQQGWETIERIVYRNKDVSVMQLRLCQV